MRKRTICEFFDNIMWYVIYMLPLIAFVIVLCSTGEVTSLASVMESTHLDIFTNNVIFQCVNNIFGAGADILPLFANADILLYFTWFVSTYIVHLAVDFLLFIPRLAHKWMSKTTED